MKHTLFATTALIGISCGSALAADLGGGLKDGPGGYDGPPERAAIWTGWFIGGSAGFANQNFDTRRTIKGSAGKFDNKGIDRLTKGSKYCTPDANEDGDFTGAVAAVKDGYKWTCPEGFDKHHVNDEDEIAHFTADDARFENDPFAVSNFARSEELETSGFQGGIELGRRVQSGRLIYEVAVGANLDAGDSDGSTYKTSHGPKVKEGALTGVGTLAVEKSHDFYAVAGLGGTLGQDQRLAVGARAGLVHGTFNVKGTHDFDGDDAGIFSTSYNSDESAFGLLIEAYLRYKLTQNLDVGLLLSYKKFEELDVSDTASKDFAFNEEGTKGIYAKVNDHTTIDPSEVVIKGTLVYTLGE